MCGYKTINQQTVFTHQSQLTIVFLINIGSVSLHFPRNLMQPHIPQTTKKIMNIIGISSTV